METIRGRKSRELDFNGLKERLANYHRVVLDLGTGDGRYVRAVANRNPDWFVIGIDSCRENLREYSQAKLQNMLFIIASAAGLAKGIGWTGLSHQHQLPVGQPARKPAGWRPHADEQA